MSQKVKTIQKVERFFTETNNCSAEDIITAYYKAVIDSVLAKELPLELVKEAPSCQEVA